MRQEVQGWVQSNKKDNNDTKRQKERNNCRYRKGHEKGEDKVDRDQGKETSLREEEQLTVDSQSNNETDSRTDSVNRLHHVMSSIFFANFSNDKRTIFQSLNISIAYDDFEVFSVCDTEKWRMIVTAVSRKRNRWWIHEEWGQRKRHGYIRQGEMKWLMESTMNDLLVKRFEGKDATEVGVIMTIKRKHQTKEGGKDRQSALQTLNELLRQRT